MENRGSWKKQHQAVYGRKLIWKYKKRTIWFFVLSLTAAVLSDLPISVWAMLNEKPTQPQKYGNLDVIVDFYWFKLFKYVSLLISFIYAIAIQYKKELSKLGSTKGMYCRYTNLYGTVDAS